MQQSKLFTASPDHYLVKNNSWTNKLFDAINRQTFDECYTKSNKNQNSFNVYLYLDRFVWKNVNIQRNYFYFCLQQLHFQSSFQHWQKIENWVQLSELIQISNKKWLHEAWDNECWLELKHNLAFQKHKKKKKTFL